MGDAALQAALARAARAPEEPETWRELTRAIRALGSSPEDLARAAARIAPFRGGPRLEAWWRHVMRDAGWVAGELVAPDPGGPFRSWALAESGDRVLAAGDDRMVLWEGPHLRTRSDHAPPPGGPVAALGFRRGTPVAVIEATDGRVVYQLLNESWEPLWEGPLQGRLLAADLDRGRLAWEDGRGGLHQGGPGLSLHTPLGEGGPPGVIAAAFAPDGTAAAALWVDGPANPYRQHPVELTPIHLPHGALGRSRAFLWQPEATLAYSPDGATLGVGGAPESASYEVRLFPVGEAHELGEGEVHTTPMNYRIHPGPGPTELCLRGGAASRWRVEEGLVDSSPSLGAESLATAGGRLLLAREASFDLLEGTSGLHLAGPGAPVVEAAFSPEGDRLWTLDARRVLRFWDWPAGTLRVARPLWRAHALPWGGGSWIGTFNPVFHEIRDAETGATTARRYLPMDHMVIDNWRLVAVPPTGDALLLASTTRRLRCLDAATGRSRWRRKLQGKEFGPVAYRAGGDTLLAMLREPGRVWELEARDGATRRQWVLPREFDWIAPGWRLDLGHGAPTLVGPGIVQLWETGEVQVLQPPCEGPCALGAAGRRRARVEGEVAVVEATRRGAEWHRVAEVPLGAPPTVLLLTPSGDGLLWAKGHALRYRELP